MTTRTREPVPFTALRWVTMRNPRHRLRAPDAYCARLYGLMCRVCSHPALERYLRPDLPDETFRVLEEKEERAFWEYRTQRLVLEAWERLEKDGFYDQ
jgi:hypothetical protein